MPQNEADRIVHERKLQQQRQEELEKQRAAQETAARAESLAREIEAEMSVVFKMLKAQGYPFAQEATIVTWKDTWLSGRKEIKEHKAAWEIGEYRYDFRGDNVSTTVELFSDGRIRAQNGPVTVSELVKKRSVDLLGIILRGLSDLKRKLEAAERQAGGA